MVNIGMTVHLEKAVMIRVENNYCGAHWSRGAWPDIFEDASYKGPGLALLL